MAMAIIDGYKVGGVDEPTVADEYNEEREWEVGEFCIYNSTLYKCNTATTGEFDSDSWDVTSCGLEMKGINSNLTVYQKTLTSGSTTVTYTNDSIDSNACFDFYAEKGHEDLLPSDWTVSGNTLTVTYDAQSENIVVGVQITKGVVVNG